MEKRCGLCKFYAPLKGEPPVGYCEFIEYPTLPFWIDVQALRKLAGSDVVPADGADCDAFQPIREGANA